jgi:hypothetical protein
VLKAREPFSGSSEEGTSGPPQLAGRLVGHRYHRRITESPTRNVNDQVQDAPLFTLRGAAVEVNARQVGRVATILVLVSMTIVAVVLFAVGGHKNSQITDLRQNGVRVTVTVTKCFGLLGGSGSNAAGDACRGTYLFDGRLYDEAIPGNRLRGPGSTVAGVVARNDPALLTTPALLETEHPSWRVYLAPGALVLADLGLVVFLVAGRRRSKPARRRPRGIAVPRTGDVPY